MKETNQVAESKSLWVTPPKRHTELVTKKLKWGAQKQRARREAYLRVAYEGTQITQTLFRGLFYNPRSTSSSQIEQEATLPLSEFEADLLSSTRPVKDANKKNNAPWKYVERDEWFLPSLFRDM